MRERSEWAVKESFDVFSLHDFCFQRDEIVSVNLKEIQNFIRKGEYRFSEHAVKRMIERAIDRFEVEHALIRGEIIEEYPDDKYSPSCLVYGKTENGRVLHIQVSAPPSVVVVTLYEPNTEEWVNNKYRR